MKLKTSIACLALMAVAAGCSEAEVDKPGKTDGEYESLTPLACDRNIVFSEAEKAVLSSPEFAFSLLDAAAKGNYVSSEGAEGNYNLSPASALAAYTLFLNGTDEPERTEIVRSLGFETMDQMNELTRKLMSYLPADGLGVDIAMANSVWVNSQFTVDRNYRQFVQDSFRAPVTAMDMTDQTKALAVINRWCADNTNNLISNVLSRLESNTAAVWANALYFFGAWEYEFDAALTADRLFKGRDGSLTVAMMRRTGLAEYSSLDGCEMVTLPFKGNNYCIDLVKAPADGLTASTYSRLISAADSYEVGLELPRFEISSTANLAAMLAGATEASRGAGLTAMGLPAKYRIGELMSIQKTIIRVNEKGAEAAAVSVNGTEIFVPGVESRHVDVSFDSEFVYFVRERRNGIILFAGRVSNL